MGRYRASARQAYRDFRGAGLDAIREGVSRTALTFGARLSPDPVFDADWDLLVVLDACRADLWQEVAASEEDLPVGTTRVSPGGTSSEWLESVFGDRGPEELADVGYVTANPYSESHVDGDRLGYLEEVWRHSWSDEKGTVRPRAVSDAAVRVGRERDLDRLVVHYMQPHFPSLADEDDVGISLDSFGEKSLTVWSDLRTGRLSRESAWESYRANLELVLEDVRLLLSNYEAERAVITADHGNAFGERHIYGHAAGVAHEPIREVPWVETGATDERTYDPDPNPEPERELVAAGGAGADVDRRLRALGYR